MKVRKNKASAKATRIFTDREEPRAAFWKKYNTVKAEMQQESNIHVLNYYGIGGIGKSRLLQKLISEMDEQLSSPRYIYIDLNICHESRAVLDRMKNKLIDNYKFNFPLYELASYVYAKRIGENADPVEVKQLTEKSPLLNMMLSAAGEIPVVGIAAKVLSFADQGVAYIRTHLKNHNREIKQLEIMEADELYKNLPYYFAQDMAHNLENEANEPLVVFIDTYEKLVNELSSIGEPLKSDEWIRDADGLIQNIPNVLWIIAGREKLKWELFDSGWSDALEPHILGSLSSADSDHFLLNAGITDVNLREQLYELTDGTPVYLDLCVDRFLRILDDGEVPDISMFGKNTFDLIERFVRYMRDEQKDLVYMLACLNKWNDSLIADIAPTVLPNFSFSAYKKAKDYSFVIASDDSYNLHQTVGSVLLEDCPVLIKQAVGKGLVDKFSKALEEKKLFSQEFSTALTYVTQAGLLLHEDREELREFYEEKISANLIDLARAGQFEQAKTVFELMLDRAEQNKNDLLYASVILDNSYFLRQTGNYNLARECAETALELYSDKKGEESGDTLLAISNLAATLSNLGEHWKALGLEQTVLKKRKAILGEDHLDTITAMNNLAITFDYLGEHQKALGLKQTVLKKRKSILGEDHPDTTTAMNNLATTLGYLGEHQKALELKQTVLEKHKTNLGEDHPDTITAMNNLAATLGYLGERQKALELNQIVLKKRRVILGEDHPDTLTAMNNLATTLSELGEHKEALELKQTVFEKFCITLGKDHPSTMTAMSNLAITLDDLGEYEKALEINQTVLEKRRVILGEDHPYTLIAMSNLATTLSNLGEYQEALGLIQTVLKKRKELLGKDHPDTILAMSKLAYTFSKLAMNEKALELYQTVLEKRRALLGEDHPDTITAMVNLANTFYGIEEYEKAQELEQTVLEKRRVLLGEDHPDTIQAMVNLSNTLCKLEKYEKSLELDQVILEKRRALLGEDHPDTIRAMRNLAYTFSKLAMNEKALELYQTVLKKRRALLGEDHPDTITALHNYAATLYVLGNYEEALGLQQIVLEKRRVVLGESHPKTINAMKKLMATLEKVGEAEKAAALCDEIQKLSENAI